MTASTTSTATVTLGVRITPEEKAELEAEAKAEGITLSLLVYRRALQKPDAVRRRGRRPRHTPEQPEGLFGMTG